jgi:transmembrane sensor
VDDKDWQRLARYYAGETSSQEEADTRRWIESDPERARTAESLRRLWNLSSTVPPRHGGDRERVWARLSSHIHGEPDAPTLRPVPASVEARRVAGRGLPRRPGRVALLLAVAAVLAALIPLASGPVSRLLRGESAPRAMREYVTQDGERLRLTLPDNSVIEIGANSRLRAATPFAARREVELEGVALFNVAPDPAHPFLVHAGGAVTRVIGTEFVVRAYSGDDAVRVAVLDGRVALRSSSATERAGAVLTRGQVGQLAAGGTPHIVRSSAEFSRLVRLTSGRLQFTDRPLAEVLAGLERWYGVEIVVADTSLSSRPVSTVIDGDRLEQVLDMIALVVDARYQQSGDTITLSPR